ncbi:S8 family peptidase [Pararhodonellum marinum]|uniref:S8 family peptidase n=1 Tax=Pararhodonellum marinum TaxID=2755358 RepID=UPI0018901D6D|nr:S8 family serine peptidase [Pararhodonellum marinum]
MDDLNKKSALGANDPKAIRKKCRIPFPPFKGNELILIWKSDITSGEREDIRMKLLNLYPDAKIRKCSKCDDDGPVELWTGDGIHNYVTGQMRDNPQVAGSTQGVGDITDTFASLNYFISNPSYPDIENCLFDLKPNHEKKKDITIAVLDTGVDLNCIPESYLWTNQNPGPCYENDLHGWNFVDNSPNIQDDHSGLHGTLVNAYIIEQFEKSTENRVKLMNIKTLNNNSEGDIFSMLCGMLYAKQNGADIINASLGYYQHQSIPETDDYLFHLITKVLRKAGILMVAASGNAMSQADAVAIGLGNDPRNLTLNPFFPAYVSETAPNSENNVVTVGTIDLKAGISPSENFSSIHVDLGVVGDDIPSDGGIIVPSFFLPYGKLRADGVKVTGSSFAAAIATGKLGANFPSDLTKSSLPGLTKGQLMTKFDGLSTGGSGMIQTVGYLSPFIRGGRYIRRD